MARTPLVSIVIPTCSRSAKLERCLEALAAQTHDAFEVIVVDDASTDDTPALLDRFASDHSGFALRSFRNDPGRGANPSRNRGIAASDASFVAFLDDDCYAEPDWLEKLMTGFVSDAVAAVTGYVVNSPPKNVFELTLKGTHRVHGGVHATRLVAGNLCVRRSLLLEHGFDEDRAGAQTDTSVSGRGDEEGLFLALKAHGHELRVAHDAVVEHDHPHSGRSFFRQAFRGGRSTARLGYKYYLRPRVELIPLLLAWLLLPVCVLTPWAWLAPALCAGLFLAAILYNERFRKRKTVGEIVITFPLVLIFFHLRLAGYVVQWLRFWLRLDRLERVKLSTP